MQKDVLLISINDDGGDEDAAQSNKLHAKRVKTEAAIRLVPVHPELLRLGFGEYVDDMRSRVGPNGLLFADLHRKGGKEARMYLSDAYWDFTRELGIYKQWRDCYSLRHTAITALKSVTPALDPDLIWTIIRHEGKSLAGKHYFKPSPELLRNTVEQIVVPAIQDLPRTYERVKKSFARTTSSERQSQQQEHP